jgi:hypothetical protein
MDESKLTNGSNAGVSAKRSVPQPKAVRSEAKVGKLVSGKKTKAGGTEAKTNKSSKPEKLVCRYCGSDDLAPSFIKRRDRRCRKCFSKRYGSVTRTKKRKVKK